MSLRGASGEKDKDKDKVLLSYNDSLLYESDLGLLAEHRWLNDRLIGFVYEYLERESFYLETSASNLLAFVNPSTVQYLKLCSSLEEAEACFLEPLELLRKEIVFFPVNDNTSGDTEGGFHWSLLVYNQKRGAFTHYDSTGSNLKEARSFFDKFKDYFDAEEFLIDDNFPRQTNSYDCGVYVLAATEIIANHVKTYARQDNDLEIDFALLNTQYANELRSKYKKLVLSMVAK